MARGAYTIKESFFYLKLDIEYSRGVKIMISINWNDGRGNISYLHELVYYDRAQNVDDNYKLPKNYKDELTDFVEKSSIVFNRIIKEYGLIYLDKFTIGSSVIIKSEPEKNTLFYKLPNFMQIADIEKMLQELDKYYSKFEKDINLKNIKDFKDFFN